MPARLTVKSASNSPFGKMLRCPFPGLGGPVHGAPVFIHEGEFEAGISSIAAPVRDMSGAVIAAISATKSSGRISKDITARVVTAGNAIGKALGAVDSS